MLAVPLVQAPALARTQTQVRGKIVIPAVWLPPAKNSQPRLAEDEVIM